MNTPQRITLVKQGRNIKWAPLDHVPSYTPLADTANYVREDSNAVAHELIQLAEQLEESTKQIIATEAEIKTTIRIARAIRHRATKFTGGTA